MPRPRKSPAQVSASRSRNAHLRWDKLSQEQRREANARNIIAARAAIRRIRTPETR